MLISNMHFIRSLLSKWIQETKIFEVTVLINFLIITITKVDFTKKKVSPVELKWTEVNQNV